MNQNQMKKVLPEFYMILINYPNYEVSTYGNVRNRTTSRILKQSNDGHGYMVVCIDGQGIKRVHKLVAFAFLNNYKNKKCVDHIDRNKLNNNILNLRYATHSENGQNRNKQKNNTSGVVGVRWDKNCNKWRAEIWANKKYLYLGLFVNFDDAVKIRKEAEVKYFGEFQAK